jgi:hypothetical protein
MVLIISRSSAWYDGWYGTNSSWKYHATHEWNATTAAASSNATANSYATHAGKIFKEVRFVLEGERCRSYIGVSVQKQIG